ncbi:Cytochrome b5 isoform B [Acorus gramineus]|uniref:Cytochrome b5 isoform B n=1 Tax=Acorus gramineus TaxID=55184 RepID=A0AAV9B802_ACOGR|nr:Cytochrome b5 isoform B [Acorus gramineus]
MSAWARSTIHIQEELEPKFEEQNLQKSESVKILESMPTLTKIFSMQEISQHNERDDCWVVIDGKVYDVTSYMDEHPGGDDVLVNATGKDATEEFEDAGHSKDARELMQQYFIGELDLTPVIPELEIFTKEQPAYMVQKLMNKVTKHWAVPATIVGISAIAGILYLRKK